MLADGYRAKQMLGTRKPLPTGVWLIGPGIHTATEHSALSLGPWPLCWSPAHDGQGTVSGGFLGLERTLPTLSAGSRLHTPAHASTLAPGDSRSSGGGTSHAKAGIAQGQVGSTRPPRCLPSMPLDSGALGETQVAFHGQVPQPTQARGTVL